MMTELTFLRSVFKDTAESFAFLTADGKLICCESKNGFSFLSPVHAARFVLQYFPLQDQDLVALNDPQSGGVTPFGVNLVGRIHNIIWSVRLEGKAVWTLDEKWEPMGFKLPPLPLRVGGRVNSQIPAAFLEKIKPFEDRIQDSYRKLKSFVMWKASVLSGPYLAAYFDKCEKLAKEKFSETPWNEYQHKAKSLSGEVLNAKISIAQEGMHADFAGSSLSHQLELNEKLTESIVTFAFTKALGIQEIYNHATESYFQLVKPKQSWLNVRESKFPAKVRFLAIPFLESHLKQMLLKMKFKMEDWKCSQEGWMQVMAENREAISSDEIQQDWASNCSFLKPIGTGDLSMQYELLNAARMIRVESGKIELHELNKGAQFEVSLI